MTLHATNITYSYTDRQLLFAGMNFSLHAGEMLELVGANGAGKTSLLQILAGLKSLEHGNIAWNGLSISDVMSDYNRDLLYLGHQPGLKAQLTARENLEYIIAMRGYAPLVNIDTALSYLQMQKFADIQIQQLSAGQERRVTLTRLLLEPAKLWLLDEPFTALDKVAIGRVCQLMENHTARGGMVIFSSHQVIDGMGAKLKKIMLDRNSEEN